MTLKIKCKDIDEYVLGGVKKIVLDEEYLYTTIYDTRKYRRVDIEKIEVIENDRQEEVDNLKVENQSLRTSANALKMHYEEAIVEIDRLQKLLDDKCDRCIENDKSESIKEFAEKLKEGIPPWLYPYIESVEKEMIGE